MAISDMLSSSGSGSTGGYGNSSGSNGVACLEFKLNISFLQCTFIILWLFLLKPELVVFSFFDCAVKGLIRAVFNETSPVCLFPTTLDTIYEIKVPLRGNWKSRFLGPSGLLPPKPRCVRKLTHGGCVVNGFSYSIRRPQSVRWGLKMKESLSRRIKKSFGN